MAAGHGATRESVHDVDEAGRFTLRGYLTGFAAAAALTALAFWIAMSGVIANAGIASVVVVVLAVAQIFIQTAAFLHVNSRVQGGWTLIAYLFTAVIVVITIAGSLWIMYHLNANMMPGMMDGAAGQMP